MSLSVIDKRKAILGALGKDLELTVRELVHASKLSEASVVAHLPALLAAKIVERRPHGDVDVYRRVQS